MKFLEQSRLPSLFPSPEDQAELTKEIRRDRMYPVVLVGSVPLLLWAILHPTVITVFIVQTYLLTSLGFGYVLFVEERENIQKTWLWKALALCIPLHAIVLLAIWLWDESNPQLAVKGLVATGVLFVPAMIELCIMLWIVELYRPRATTQSRTPERS
jgi:hypothetical protein